MSDIELSQYELCAVVEAVRLYEIKNGTLDDAAAVAHAVREKPELEARIISRALFLAAQHGWTSGANHVREKPFVSPTTMLFFASILAGILIGRGIASGAPGTINALSWIGGILVAQFLGITAWFLSFKYQHGGMTSLFTWIDKGVSRWLNGKGFEFSYWQARAILDQRHAIARWRVGMTVHGAWIALSVGMLGTVFLVLALSRIDIGLETTILGERSFLFVVNSLGALPSYLGFPLPSEAEVRQALQGIAGDDVTRSTWGWWIIGILVVWVLSPRVVLWLTCGSFVRKREASVTLDLADPDSLRLRARLLPPSENATTVDPDPNRKPVRPRHARGNKECAGAPLVIGLEITDRSWPPPLPYPIRDGGVIHDLKDQHRILERLDQDRPAALLIACDAALSPDRGSLKQIREYTARAGSAAVLLIPSRNDGDDARISVWRSAIAPWFDQDRTFTDEREALEWLKTPEARSL